MQPTHNEAEAIESAALRLESAEQAAEQRFDAVYAAAERDGTVHAVTTTAEFREWMAARAATDAAWGRWAMSVGDAAARKP